MVPNEELKKLRAFHKSPQLKKDMVAEVLRHQKLDKIIKRTYGKDTAGEDFRGCAVGCSINSYNLKYGENISTDDHSAYQTKLGIPESLARLEDYLFETMPDDKAKLWPVEFMKAIPVGANLSKVAPKFIVGTLKDLFKIKEVKDDKAVYKAIAETAKLWNRVVAGKIVKDSSWSAAESAAWSAAESAARSAAWSAAESAARSAAWSAAWSAARSAAWSAAWSAAESAAWSAAWSAAESAAMSAAAYKMSRRLLKITKSCK